MTETVVEAATGEHFQIEIGRPGTRPAQAVDDHVVAQQCAQVGVRGE
ncbi:hypothetical protein [Nocardia thraciensis]